jgi:4-hydroxyphenylpyruvate dioxygenase-like putative hemolysin
MTDPTSAHHLALQVDDVAAALADAVRHGLRPIDRSPHAGARGTLVGFVDPGRAEGVLIQYVQEPDSASVGAVESR